jgi:hypothetical protein
MAGLLSGPHPDVGGKVHYRRGAAPKELRARRHRARVHWKKYASAS